MIKPGLRKKRAFYRLFVIAGLFPAARSTPSPAKTLCLFLQAFPRQRRILPVRSFIVLYAAWVLLTRLFAARCPGLKPRG